MLNRLTYCLSITSNNKFKCVAYGLLATACAAIVVGCSGTYKRNGKCWRYWEMDDGTKVVEECETEETFTFETKSWREIMGMDGPDPVYRYYYVGELYDEQSVLIDSWEWETTSQFQAVLPDILDAAGETYTAADLQDIMSVVTSNWVNPDTDWHQFN